MIQTRKAQELDVVELSEDLPEYGLKKGERGVVVVAFDNPDEAYMLEFVDESGTSSRFANVVKPEQIINIDAIAREALERGIKLHNEGRGKEAEPEFRRAIELNPRNIEELHNRIVKGFDVSGALDNFIFAMRLVLRLDPGYEVARNNLAIAYENQGVQEANEGNLYGAINRFRIALAVGASPDVISYIKSNLATAYTRLGVQACQKNEFEGSLQFMNLAYEVNPNDETKRNLAIAYAYAALSFINNQDLQVAKYYLEIAYDITMRTLDQQELVTDKTNYLRNAVLEFLRVSGNENIQDISQLINGMSPLQQHDYKTAA
jgi:tetratricopeptide (TPR) repeat protein